MRTRSLSLSIALCFSAFAASPLRADVPYTNTGNDFTTVALPYTASVFETIVLDFAAPLSANLNTLS